MLQIEIPEQELFDEKTEMFVSVRAQKLQLEHSLVSISKWEARHQKPFLTKTPKTRAETRDYIRCMTLTQNVKPEVYSFLTLDNFKAIERYIESPMTATTFSKRDDKKTPNREIVTSELIYYWMIMYGIPFECQKWHLNRLLTLIQVCTVKETPPRKRSRRELLEWQRAENMRRRSKYGTKG